MAWSPNGRFLAVLLQENQTLSMHVVDTSQESLVLGPALTSGAPLFSSWSPDSKTLLMHVNGDHRVDPSARLARLDVEAGEVEPLPVPPGSFNAPAWAPNGRDWAFATSAGDREDALCVRRGNRSVLVAQGYNPGFAWAPRGHRLAYAARSDRRGDFYSGLWVTNGDGPGVRLTGDRLLAFFWSPDGRQLAYFSPGADELTLLVIDTTDGSRRNLASFAPTQQFGQVMSFFDQYAQSHAIWSPDGQQVVFAGIRTSGNGTSNNPHIFAAAADGSGVQQLADGGIAFWSPSVS